MKRRQRRSRSPLRRVQTAKAAERIFKTLASPNVELLGGMTEDDVADLRRQFFDELVDDLKRPSLPFEE